MRANVPRGDWVAAGTGGAVALAGDAGVAAYALPKLVVTGASPASDEEQVAALFSAAIGLLAPKLIAASPLATTLLMVLFTVPPVSTSVRVAALPRT